MSSWTITRSFRTILQNVPNGSHLPWSVSPGSIQNSLRMRDGKDPETLCLDVLGGCVHNTTYLGYGYVTYALVYSIYPFVFCKFHSFPKCNRSHRQKDNECQSKCLFIKDQCCWYWLTMHFLTLLQASPQFLGSLLANAVGTMRATTRRRLARCIFLWIENRRLQLKNLLHCTTLETGMNIRGVGRQDGEGCRRDTHCTTSVAAL